MDQTVLIDQIKRRTLDNDPQYFGGYLNMARHNIFMLINHLTEKFSQYGYTKIKDDKLINPNEIDEEKPVEHILSHGFRKKSNIPDEDKMKLLNYINKRQFLPFIRYFKEKIEDPLDNTNFENLSTFLNVAFTELDNYRNDYTHYLKIDNSGKQLERKRNIDLKIVQEIKSLFEKAPEYSLLRHFETQSKDDFEHLKPYRIFEEQTENKFTDQGLFFFISLFLERKQAYKFLKRFTGFKNENIPSFKATLKTFSAYCLRTPKDKMVNDDFKQAILMEMINELNKCPKELYNHLTEADQNEFKPDLGDNEKANIALNSINYDNIDDNQIEDLIQNLSTRKRSNDRFPYFALRYIDEMNVFKNLRFQIQLGKLELRKYDKSIAGVTQIRRIVEPVNTFGKLSDFMNEEEVLSKLKETSNLNDETYFEQFAPHYNISNNKIGFYIFENDENKIKYQKFNSTENQPTSFISIHDLQKIVLTELLAKNQIEKLIKEFIDTTNTQILDFDKLSEIKSKALLQYVLKKITRKLVDNTKFLTGGLLKKQKEKVEDYQKRMLERRLILQNILNEYNLNLNHFPSKISDYLLNLEEPKPDKIFHFSKRLHKVEIKQKLKELKSEKEHKLGELATFIARDIINMVVDKDVKKKITSPYYNKLQNQIAFFSISKQNIIDLCDELSLFNHKTGHVFLTKEHIRHSKSVIDFYTNYLHAKKTWLENKNIKKATLPLTFTKYLNKRDFDIEDYLKEKEKLPVNIPNALFTEKLNQILSSKVRQTNTELTGAANWLALLLDNDTQPFYHYKRKYKIKEEPEAEPKEKMFSVNEMNSKQIKQQYGRFVEENEKQIRFIQTKDRIMRLMCEAIIKEDKTLDTSQEEILLKNAHPNSEYNPLDTPYIFKKRLDDLNGKTYNIIAKDSDAWIEVIEKWKNLSNDEKRKWESLPNEEKERQETRKAWFQWTFKDYGRFQRLLHDKRLKTLLPYLGAKEIPFCLVEYELNEYDHYREKIFDKIFDIEKAIIKKDETWLKNVALNSKYENIQFDKYTKWIDSKNINYDKELIKWGRNTFSHTQYPSSEKVGVQKISEEKIKEFENRNHEKGYKGNSYKSIASKIYDNYKQKTDELIQLIENLP